MRTLYRYHGYLVIKGKQVTVTLVNLSADTNLATRIHLDDARALGARGQGHEPQ